MDKQQIRDVLDTINDRLNELYINNEIGGDDMDDFNNWLELIRKELTIDDLVNRVYMFEEQRRADMEKYKQKD